MAKKVNVKDKLLHDTLDLSCCELKEVPVKEISVLRRAAIVDLSNNDLVSLPKNFVTLTQIIKLDLSKNNLKELPENFGDLVHLKHLDLYKNQISRLPLSLGNLKSLRWLDLKENPLTTAVATVAGPCANEKDCQNCARNVVNYLSKVKQSFDAAEKLRKEMFENDQSAETKKDNEQKKKKKKSDKEKNNTSNGKQTKDKHDMKSQKGKSKSKTAQTKQGGFISLMLSAFYYMIILSFLSLMVIPFLPNAIEIFTFIKEKTGLPVQPIKLDLQIPPLLRERAQNFYNQSRQLIEHYYQKYFI